MCETGGPRVAGAARGVAHLRVGKVWQPIEALAGAPGVAHAAQVGVFARAEGKVVDEEEGPQRVAVGVEEVS